MPTKKPPRATRKDGTIDWDKQARFDMEFAKRMLLDQGSVPTFWVLQEPERSVVLVTPFSNDEFKQRCLDLIGVWIRAKGVLGVSVISEVWMKEVPRHAGETEAELNERATEVPPSQSEARREAVMVQTMYRDADGKRVAIMRTCEIKRGADGKPSSFGELSTIGGKGKERNEGAFVEVFPEYPPSQADIELTRLLLPIVSARLGMTKIAEKH